MIDLKALQALFHRHFENYRFDNLHTTITEALSPEKHSRIPEWKQILDSLPAIPAGSVDLKDSAISVQSNPAADARVRADLMNRLQLFHPWRKGPYDIHGVRIDTEWRSDWKWDRLKNNLPDVTGKKILDVGCGNGYHCWRIRGEGAAFVVGIDPYMLSVVQFYAIRHFIGDSNVFVLPLAMETLPPDGLAFDTVFSMGVLYHRRSPLDHLLELHAVLNEQGNLILETLVIEGGAGETLLPKGRYARMRNVWFIPSCKTLEIWLKRCGYRHIELIDVTKTTVEEQRSTEWMRFHSLEQFLDPENPALTAEGYPAPRRAIFMAEKS